MRNLIAFLLFASCALLSGCKESSQAPAEAATPAEDLPVTDDATGGVVTANG